MSKNVYIGFDFSISKPAATVYCDKKLYFYLWPSKSMTDKNLEKYASCNVNVTPRCLSPISKNIESSRLVLIHTIRSVELANLIIEQLDELLKQICPDDYDLYVCSEGLSYGSAGDATLNLATYKGVFLGKIYEHYGDKLKRLFTYSPTTLKSTAGCATKEKRGDKINMIRAFIKEPYTMEFKTALLGNDLVAKTNYIEGVDDLVDSYWALKTMMKAEKLSM